MAFILDGNPEIKCARAVSGICYLICLSNLVRSRAATKLIFFSSKIRVFLYAFATRSKFPSNIITMGISVNSPDWLVPICGRQPAEHML